MIYGVPYYMGERVEGAQAPAGAKELRLDPAPGSQQARMAEIYTGLADRIAENSEFPIAWGIDCVIIIGVLAGLQRRGVNPLIVFFDAHGDFNTWDTTPSGFIGGMPLAMITGRGEQSIMEACGASVVPDRDAILIDGRDLDPEEAELLGASDVDRLGVEDLLPGSDPRRLPAGRPLYVHIDTDVVDPIEMPAVNYVAPGGPSLEQVALATRALAATGDVVAFSVAAHNPDLEGADKSHQAALAIAAPFL